MLCVSVLLAACVGSFVKAVRSGSRRNALRPDLPSAASADRYDEIA